MSELGEYLLIIYVIDMKCILCTSQPINQTQPIRSELVFLTLLQRKIDWNREKEAAILTCMIYLKRVCVSILNRQILGKL